MATTIVTTVSTSRGAREKAPNQLDAGTVAPAAASPSTSANRNGKPGLYGTICSTQTERDRRPMAVWAKLMTRLARYTRMMPAAVSALIRP